MKNTIAVIIGLLFLSGVFTQQANAGLWDDARRTVGGFIPSIDDVIEVGSALLLNPVGISAGFLWDGDIFGNDLGVNWGGIQELFGNNKNPSPKDSFEKCLDRKPSDEELDAVMTIAKEKGWSGQQIAVALCKSEEAKNKDEADAEDQSPSETFLWKPKSDSDGKLVVLLPSSMRGQVVSVAIMKNGQSIETGRFSGDEHNGMRPHFRFSKPGADYGTDIEVVSAGTTGMCSFKIPNGAKRTEGVTPNCGAGVGMGAGFGGAGYAGGFIYDPGTGGVNVDEYLNSLTGGTSKNACYNRGQTVGNSLIKTSGKCFSTITGDPFFPIADTAWQIFRLSSTDLDKYVKARKAQGFNVIKFVGVGFGGTYEQYDLVFQKLAENDMYAEIMLDSSQYDKSVAFVNRYKNKSNLFLWVAWGLDNRRSEAEVVALMRGIKANDSNHLVTAHPKGRSSTSALSAVNPLSPIYYVHSYAVGSAESLIKSDVAKGDKPVYQGEPAYDGSRNSASSVKNEIEKSFNAGAAGISYGHDNIWQGCAASGQRTTVTGVTYTCNNSVLNSLNTTATAWIKSTFSPNTTLNTNNTTTENNSTWSSSSTLAISCKISDRSIEVGEETEISVDISGGTSPYKVRWSGDTSKIRKISKTKNDQDIEFKKAGKYVLEVKVTDKADTKVEEVCSAITVYEKGAVPASEASDSTNYTSPQTYPSQQFAFYRDLTIGSEGADVIALQDYLISRGFLNMPNGVAKGYFGNLTREAVARWQASVGLTPPAGYFGQKSRSFIATGIVPASAPVSTYVAPVTTTAPARPTVSAASCVNVRNTLVYEQSSSDVAKVQDFLEMKGFLVMPEGVAKGTYGKLTATAVGNYMATKGISTSGRVADESVLSQIRKDTGCAN